MTVTEAMHWIEQPEFCALVNVASSLKVFLRILTSQDSVKTLLEAMDQSGVPELVLSRILQLTEIQPEEGFEHPADAALATYLWILSEKKPQIAALAAESVLRCERCWWARKLAEQCTGKSTPDNGNARQGRQVTEQLASKQPK